MPPLYPLDSEFFYQMGIAPLPPEIDVSTLKIHLYDKYRVEIPLIEWNGHKFVRISVQGYNTQSDLEALLAGLEALLPVMSS